jgi:hypothetical protein
MGWAAGSELMEEVIKAAKIYVPVKKREMFYKRMIKAFEDLDCDTLDECRGQDKHFDAVMVPLDEEDLVDCAGCDDCTYDICEGCEYAE